jgi:hypothetical protein
MAQVVVATVKEYQHNMHEAEDDYWIRQLQGASWIIFSADESN